MTESKQEVWSLKSFTLIWTVIAENHAGEQKTYGATVQLSPGSVQMSQERSVRQFPELQSMVFAGPARLTISGEMESTIPLENSPKEASGG